MRERLAAITFPERQMQVCGLLPHKCKAMSSKKRPLWLTFKRYISPAERARGDKRDKHLTVLFKAGDDLRQDQLTLQVLRVMDSLWKEIGLDLVMLPYGCNSSGDEQGLIEVVQHAETLASIVAKSAKDKTRTISRISSVRKMMAAREALFDSEVVLRWLVRHNHPARPVTSSNLQPPTTSSVS